MLNLVLNKKCQIASDTSCIFPAYAGSMLLLPVQECSQSTWLPEFSGRQRARFGGELGARVSHQVQALIMQKAWKCAHLLNDHLQVHILAGK